MRHWLLGLWPQSVGIDGKEALRMTLGVVLGLLVTGFLSRWWAGSGNASWMIASLSASAVLVFGMPASPLAQPWPVLGGTVVAALVSTLCSLLVPDLVWAAALAVGGALAGMLLLRCFHPPGVGMAAFVVLEHSNGLELIVFPVLFNILVLLACAMVYNNATGKPYPQRSRAQRNATGGHFQKSDLDAALENYNQVLDISRSDLEGLLHLAGRAAFQRTLGELRCADIMSTPALAVEADVPLKDAWALMRQKNIKALPVVDGQHQVIGMLSLSDFMRTTALESPEGWGQRLRQLVSTRAKKPQTVSDLMSASAQTAFSSQHVMDLIPLFSSGGHHHLPIVDAELRLAGVITQTDLVRALAAAITPS
ncbi:HPP family protein [Acidovorax sp. Be4]|uniref:HPP family protein n=1 Tax=Acidovorax bellezanensis TaxID=2976702 RepID=A0ABT2PPL8_9BURK|nr:HPP family protein [Acidovorax sp. Be4]MCT9812240.1 HPP family protein [Acidovorax sp. Be4]